MRRFGGGGIRDRRRIGWHVGIEVGVEIRRPLGIDSLQTLDLLTKLENHFHVELPDYEMQGVSDLRALAGKIQARL